MPETVLLADLALDDIAGELRRCWALLRDVNRTASTAQAYKILEQLEANPDKAAELIDCIDPRVRHLIEETYPGGWMALQVDGPDPQMLINAISNVRSSLPKPKKGRPAGTKDFASERLASALADIYERYTNKRATRRLLVDESKESETHVEYGPFKDFVDETLAVIPPILRRTRRGGLRGSDNFVRTAVQSRKV